MVVSLATQLGIPLNLMIDVILNPGTSAGALDSMAVVGVGLMLGSFMLSTAAEKSRPANASDDDGRGRGRGSSVSTSIGLCLWFPGIF